MEILRDHASEELIDRMLEFSITSCRASSAFFRWIDREPAEDLRALNPAVKTINVPEAFGRAYLGGYGPWIDSNDPLRVGRLVAGGSRVAMLQVEKRNVPRNQASAFLSFLRDFDIADELDMVFWNGSEPIAYMGLLRRFDEPPFLAEDFDWESARRYFESTLKTQWHMRMKALERILSRRFKLTRRELQVVEFLMCGCDNRRISENLGVSLATTKTYVVKILDKLGVESRLAIVAFALRILTEADFA